MSDVSDVSASDLEYHKGDQVVFDFIEEFYTQYDYYKGIEGNVYEIRRVYKNKVEINGTFLRSGAWTEWVEATTTISVEKSHLRPANGPRPRRLGEVPEGGISPDDPGLKWLWEDAANLARRSGHCGQYDKMCEELGIPGRRRSFKVTTTVNGLDITTSVKATSRKEAEEMVQEALNASTAKAHEA